VIPAPSAVAHVLGLLHDPNPNLAKQLTPPPFCVTVARLDNWARSGSWMKAAKLHLFVAHTDHSRGRL
jgi:hypothetical protein